MLLVLVIFASFYSLTWYCKKLERKRKRRAALAQRPYLFRPSNPTNEFVDLTDEIILGRILEENISANRLHESPPAEITCHVAPPPKYAEALNMPKVQTSPSAPTNGPVHSVDSEPLPTYDSVVPANKDDSPV